MKLFFLILQFLYILFVPQIQCKDIVLEHGDVSKALIEYTSQSAIEHLVIGSSSKSSFLKYSSASLFHPIRCKF